MKPLELPEQCPAAGPFSALTLKPIRPDLWRVKGDFVYDPPAGLPGPAIVEDGTETDLDSVPRLPLAYWLVKGRTIHGAVTHDGLYKTGRLRKGGPKVSRRVADRIFLAAMRDEGVRWYYRWAIWLMVRLFGWRSWNRYRRAEGRA